MNPYQMKKEDVLKMLETDENGLTQNQAKENQKKYGKNELAEGKKKNPFILFLEQYKDFLVIRMHRERRVCRVLLRRLYPVCSVI